MDAASLAKEYPSLGMSLGEALLTPTKIYVKTLKSISDSGITIKGCSHITGGGWVENIPRMMAEKKHQENLFFLSKHYAVVDKRSYPIPPIFKLIQETGGLSEETMYRTFNMGLGMVLAVAAEEAERAIEAIRQSGEEAWVVGRIVKTPSIFDFYGKFKFDFELDFEKDILCLR
jgi:phosphoribosylformylglycinamidine cyclo-ligase